MEHQKQITQLLDGKVSAKEIIDFIDNLPPKIRAMLPEDEHALLDRIELLNNKISKGRVLKITIDNYLENEDTEGKGTDDDRTGTSTGLLYLLDDGAEINIHKHTEDIETYVSIEKVLKLPAELDEKQQELSANICPINLSHGIGKLPKGTLIGTFKVRKDCIKNQVQSKDRNERGPLYKEGSEENAREFDSGR